MRRAATARETAFVQRIPMPRRVPRDHERRASAEADVARLRARADEIAAIDFFDPPGREAAIALVEGLEARLRCHPIGVLEVDAVDRVTEKRRAPTRRATKKARKKRPA